MKRIKKFYLDNLLKIVFIFLLIFFTFNLKAEDDYVMYGAVTNSCSEMDNLLSYYIEEDPITIKDYVIATFQGYLSGLNFYINELTGKYKRLNEYSAEYMFEYVKVYCKNNSNETFADALTDFILSLPDIK